MTAVLDPLRSWLRPQWRQPIYNTIGALCTGLAALGVAAPSTLATYAQLILSAVTLLFALLYSTSELRVAVYGLIVAIQAVIALFGIGTADDPSIWPRIIAAALAVFGTQLAAARTPVPIDVPEESTGRHGANRTEIDR